MATLLERIHQEVKRAPTSHGPSSDGPFPVLSPSEIAEAEVNLGFQIPQLLKQLYLEVGNGGFGPGYGLLPLTPCGDLKEGRFVVDLYVQYQKSKNFDVSILPFASWGCGIFSCLDLSEGADPPVYRFEPNLPNEFTFKYLKGMPYRGAGLIPEGATLSEWLCEWLDGNAEQMFKRMNLI